MAKAELILGGSDEPLSLVWWEPGRAPPDESRVRIKGQVKEFNGETQIHVNETVVDRTTAVENPLAAIAAFYLGCIEAEAAASLRFKEGEKGHIELHDTASPLHESLYFPKNSQYKQWFHAREKNIGEPLIAGWPIIVGPDPDTGKGALVSTPLLVAEVELCESNGKWCIQHLGVGADLNPFALDLLDLDRETRDEIIVAVESSVEVEESNSSAARSNAILQALQEEGIEGLDELNPVALSILRNTKGIHNSGVVMTAASTAGSVRSLIDDLEELANYPELLSGGPAAVLLGKAPASEVPLPAPHPTIALSSLRQDQAVHSAMTNVFTVVTGPPGTGKSQVLLNVVSAAVAKGETVLIASKNNRAVDVVVDRLRSASPNAFIVRAGSAGKRNEVADYITSALAANGRNVDSADAHRIWASVEKRLEKIYEDLRERGQFEAELKAQENKLETTISRLPSGFRTDVVITELDEALNDAHQSLNTFGKFLCFFGRKRRHRERLEKARLALGRVGDILGADHADLEECLSSVAD